MLLNTFFMSSIICIASVIRQLYFTDRRSICDTSYCPRSGTETGLISRSVILLSVFLRFSFHLLAVVAIASTCSCELSFS